MDIWESSVVPDYCHKEERNTEYYLFETKCIMNHKIINRSINSYLYVHLGDISHNKTDLGVFYYKIICVRFYLLLFLLPLLGVNSIV